MGAVLMIDLPEELEETLKAVGYTRERLSTEAHRYLAAALFIRKI